MSKKILTAIISSIYEKDVASIIQAVLIKKADIHFADVVVDGILLHLIAEGFEGFLCLFHFFD